MDFSIRQILLATDFSESSKQAQGYAVGLAISLGARLSVLHVVHDPEPLPSVTGVKVDVAKMPLRQVMKNAEETLAAQMADDMKRCPQIHCVVKAGDVAPQIKDYADAHEMDLIVIGTHGRTGLSHLVLGSVAEKLVRIATCPVLTVNPHAESA